MNFPTIETVIIKHASNTDGRIKAATGTRAGLSTTAVSRTRAATATRAGLSTTAVNRTRAASVTRAELSTTAVSRTRAATAIRAGLLTTAVSRTGDGPSTIDLRAGPSTIAPSPNRIMVITAKEETQDKEAAEIRAETNKNRLLTRSSPVRPARLRLSRLQVYGQGLYPAPVSPEMQ